MKVRDTFWKTATVTVLALSAMASVTSILGYLKIEKQDVGAAVREAMREAHVVEAGPPPPAPVAFAGPAFGWVPPSDDQVRAALDPARTVQFADTPAGKAVMAADADVYLWRFVRKAANLDDRAYPNVNQLSVGCCVGCGWKHAVDIRSAVQIMRDGAREAWKPISVESIYGPSRVEIGKGQIRGDGSVGAWADKAVRQVGVLAMEAYPAADLTVFSPARARQWGQSGMPDALEPTARQHPVKTTALVRTAAEAEKAIRQGYPIAVCSGQGFTMTRGADGFARASGSWAHCMCICGVRGGPRPGFFLLNSWGDEAHTGGVFPPDMPVAGFWAEPAVVGRMLAGNDSYAVSSLAGFPRQDEDFFVVRPARRELVRPADLLALAP
jgi:hypothetical protein